jgi:nucleoporin POM152
MNGTPRLRSAYPLSPQGPIGHDGRPLGDRRDASPSRIYEAKPAPDPNAPLIPFELIDAPTQRLYVIAFYGLLGAWRLWDFWHLESDGPNTLWKFLWWVAIDVVMLFSLPSFKIPWLEWSFSTTLAAILLHIILDAFLMFQIPVRH